MARIRAVVERGDDRRRRPAAAGRSGLMQLDLLNGDLEDPAVGEYVPTPAWTVHHGDAFAWLAEQPDASVDHVICDPPYDERTHKGARTAPRKQKFVGDLYTKEALPLGIDFGCLPSADIGRLVIQCLRVSRRWVVCFCAVEMVGAYRDAAGGAWVRSGFWRRTDGAPQFTGDRPGQPGEALAIMHRAGKKRWNGGGKHGFWVCGVERVDRCHPTQKPIKLMRQLVEDFTEPGELVADPFMGSGSTGAACVQLGRRFVGVEGDPKHVESARARMDAATLGLSLQEYRAGQTVLGL